MTDTSENTPRADQSDSDRTKQCRLFDFDKVVVDGNRTSNLRVVIYKLINGFDVFERHYLAAAFIKTHHCRTVLDLGGLVGKLQYFLSAGEYAIDVVNTSGKAEITYDGKTLPSADGTYDCVVSLDVLEHVLPDQRPDFLKELLRVTSRYLFLSVPYKSAIHERVEQRLFDLHREAFHADHPFLKEHLENGLVDEKDCRDMVDGLDSTEIEYRTDFFFTGNIVAVARPVEKLWTLRVCSPAKHALNYPALTLEKVGLREKLDCSTEPNPETNRLYLLVEKTRKTS